MWFKDVQSTVVHVSDTGFCIQLADMWNFRATAELALGIFNITTKEYLMTTTIKRIIDRNDSSVGYTLHAFNNTEELIEQMRQDISDLCSYVNDKEEEE